MISFEGLQLAAPYQDLQVLLGVLPHCYCLLLLQVEGPSDKQATEVTHETSVAG